MKEWWVGFEPSASPKAVKSGFSTDLPLVGIYNTNTYCNYLSKDISNAPSCSGVAIS